MNIRLKSILKKKPKQLPTDTENVLLGFVCLFFIAWGLFLMMQKHTVIAFARGENA